MSEHPNPGHPALAIVLLLKELFTKKSNFHSKCKFRPICFFIFLFFIYIYIFPVKAVGTYNFDRKNMNLNRKDALYGAKFYMKPTYQRQCEIYCDFYFLWTASLNTRLAITQPTDRKRKFTVNSIFSLVEWLIWAN